MDSAQGNPVSNALAAGITDAMVRDAVTASGYPLQLTVARSLSKMFLLREEWSYQDSEINSIRTMDLLASRMLYDHAAIRTRTRPGLNLVIECKRSDLPFVFFLTETTPWMPDFPLIAGLRRDTIRVITDDSLSSWIYNPLTVLSMDSHPFVRTSVPHCVTFSKCVRSGKELSLSGSEAYQSIILPITKATRYLKLARTPPKTARYFDCELTIGLAVIDAPMVSVRLEGSETKVELAPWIRVVRHEPRESDRKVDRSQVLGIDIVHRGFLNSYVDQHVMPFAETFASLCLKHNQILADGLGFVPGMEADSRTNIEQRLRIVDAATKSKHEEALAKRMAASLVQS